MSVTHWLGFTLRKFQDAYWNQRVYKMAMANKSTLVLNEVKEGKAQILTAGYSIWEFKI